MQSDTQNLRQRWIYHRRITTVWQCLHNHDWPHSVCLTMEFRGDRNAGTAVHWTHFRATPDVTAQRGNKNLVMISWSIVIMWQLCFIFLLSIKPTSAKWLILPTTSCLPSYDTVCIGLFFPFPLPFFQGLSSFTGFVEEVIQQIHFYTSKDIRLA